MNLPQVNHLNKAGIQGKAQEDALAMLEAGEVDATKVLAHARKIREYLDSYLKAIDSQVRTDLLAYQGKLEVDGVKLELSSSGERLDYSQDPEYARLQEQLKHREALLKLAHKSKEDVVDADGALVIPPPLKSASREILRVTL